MLAVNDVILNLNDPKAPYTQEVLEKFREIREKYGKEFSLVFRDKFGVRINPTGHKEPSKKAAIPYVSSVLTDKGQEIWRYSDSYPTNGKYKRKRFIFQDSFIVTHRQIELAFFLLYKSDFVKNGYLKLVDKRGDAQKQVKAKQKMVSTRWYLYDEKSPLYTAEETVRMIALAFGVPRADDKNLYSLDQVKLKLEAVIENAEIDGNYEKDEKAFKRAIEDDGIIKLKALVQTAIDNDIVSFENPSWFFLDSKGEPSEKICTVPSIDFDRADDVLIEYLKRNVVHREAFETALDKIGVFEVSNELTKEMLDKMSFVDKKKWGKKFGFNKFIVKEDEITAFLEHKISK